MNQRSVLNLAFQLAISIVPNACIVPVSKKEKERIAGKGVMVIKLIQVVPEAERDMISRSDTFLRMMRYGQ